MLEANLTGVVVLMRCRSEWGPLLESMGSQLAGCAQKKGTTASAASL